MASPTPIDAKIVLLGSASVGKTSIICRAVSDEFDKDMPPTIGACYTAKSVVIANTTVNLQIWDTAGQERFRTLAPMYFRGSSVALLVYSIIDDSSLTDAKVWAEEVKQQTEEMPTLFVIGNKTDLVEERKVLTETGQNVAQELGAHFTEVSAKTGDGIDELILRIAEEAIKKLETGPKPGTVQARRSSVVLKSEPTGKQGGCKC
jgi:small GTP-binding protein